MGAMSIEPITRKSLGQHWLNDETTLKYISQLAKLEANDTVLEIGPGTGSLTKIILESGAKVIALELDETLVSLLRSSLVDSSNLEIEFGDIRRYNLTKLPASYKIVANIPYYLTANLLRILIDTTNKPKTTVLLVQKEVAQRVAAVPGDMSFISLAVQLYYQVSLGPVVPAKLFTPPPKIDSQVLILNRLDKHIFTSLEAGQFLRVCKGGFAQPRKTLANNLSGSLQIDKSTTEQVINSSGLAANVRAQELDPAEWYKLYQILLPKLPT